MEERNVLSTEEVEAIIQAAQTASEADEIATADVHDENAGNINTNAFNNVLENTRAEIENKLTVLLRKKIAVKLKAPVKTNLEEFLKQANENNVYSSFKFMPYNSPVVVCTEHSFLDTAINLLYGGKIQANGSTPAPAPIGKMGLITAEKMNAELLDCFSEASKEHIDFTSEHYKTSNVLANINNIPNEEPIHTIEFSIFFNELEVKLILYLTEEFLIKLFPVKTGRTKHREKDFWRTAIKSEVMDSYVTISTTMADVHMKVKEFMNLKEGDEIPIVDPTLVFVCLNNLKLFRALAGQSNSKIVAKIVSQV